MSSASLIMTSNAYLGLGSHISVKPSPELHINADDIVLIIGDKRHSLMALIKIVGYLEDLHGDELAPYKIAEELGREEA